MKIKVQGLQVRESCAVVNDLEAELIEEESEGGREEIEGNDDTIVDADVINHFKETFESYPEIVINRFNDDYEYHESVVASFMRKLQSIKN